MKTIVGIFDANTPEQVEEAAKRLADAELDAVIIDESILGQEPGSLDPAIPALAPAATVEAVKGREEPNLLPRRDKQRVIRAFRERLADDYRLSNEVTEAYATTLAHGGRFVIVRADSKDAEKAVQLLRDSGASRVNKHD
jgi:hypothetical protein